MNKTTSPLPRTRSWFKPELRTKDYNSLGDAYDDARYNYLAEKWNVEPSPDDNYLTLVKQASRQKWIHLRPLADFMQIGRIPRDWSIPSVVPKDQKDRWGLANICVLDYTDDAAPRGRRIVGKGLETAQLKSELRIGATQDPAFRLYVVEDLSRNVIEALGTEFCISPDFFRAHITDYAWYNVRDRWREPQPLEVVRSERNWFRIRYVTTRYIASKKEQAESDTGGGFEEAAEEAKGFNIMRRPDDDKSRGWWDSEDAVVALTRSRATFWLKPKDSKDKTAIGVLLLDPTVSQGLPLWRGHGNFHPVPSTLEAFQSEAERKTSTWETATYDKPRSFFEDFIYWSEHPEVFRTSRPGFDTPREHLPVQTLLHLIGSEWLTMCDYIKTRLNQIDLETVDPARFAEKGNVEVALDKLHMWRRFIPLYREMVAETLQHVFHFPFDAAGSMIIQNTGSANTRQMSEGAPPGASCPVPTTTTEHTNHTRYSAHGTPTTAGAGHGGGSITALSTPSSINAYEQDFRLVLAYLEECQQRIDRLTSVVTAVMAVDDTRRANNDARNIGRLTWLATFFIPFSVVSGIFSMQKLSEISMDTIRIYFATTLPVAVVTVVFAWALHSPAVREWLYRKR